MIFKQVDEILSGRKVQTRRVCKPNERMAITDVYRVTEVEYDDAGGIWSWDGRIKWAIGRTYAVVPKRGMSTVWWKRAGKSYLTHNGTHDWHYPADPDKSAIALPVTHLQLKSEGWQPLRIRITDIRQEPLQFIMPAGAYMEGVESVEEYKALWESINKRKGTRWEDNPSVWVLTFELVKEAL